MSNDALAADLALAYVDRARQVRDANDALIHLDCEVSDMHAKYGAAATLAALFRVTALALVEGAHRALVAEGCRFLAKKIVRSYLIRWLTRPAKLP